VTDEGGNPLSDIAVSAYTFVADPSGGGYWSSYASTTTGASGFYNLSGMAAGTYRIEFSDYRWPRQYSREFYADVLMIEEAKDIVVAAGSTVTGIDAQVARTGHITGRVTDKNGDAVSNITVSALQSHVDSAGSRYWWYYSQTATDSNGMYDLAGLDVGDYRIEFRDNNWPLQFGPEYYDDAATVEAGTDISVATGTTVSGIDAQLSDPSHITGRVTDEQGAPLADIQVTAYRFVNDGAGGFWSFWRDVLTDATGAYDLIGLEPGAYRVGFYDWSGPYQPEFYDNALSVETASDILVERGTTTANIDAQLVPLAATNVAPLAVNDEVALASDSAGMLQVAQAVSILANDGDSNGDALTAVLLSGPRHGALTLNLDGTFTYTPDAGHITIDQFTYQVSDGQVLSNVATVTLLVNGATLAPTHRVFMPLVNR
jgi:VCBS repeat-containing protein